MQEVRRRRTFPLAPVGARRGPMQEVPRRRTSPIAPVGVPRGPMQEVRRRRTSRIAPVGIRRGPMQEVPRRRTFPIAPVGARRGPMQGPRATLLTGSHTRRAGRRPASNRKRPPSSPCDTGRSARRPARARRASRRPGRSAVRRGSAPRPSSTTSPATLGPSPLTCEELHPPRRGELRGFERRLARTSGVLHAHPGARDDRRVRKSTAAKWDSGTVGRRRERGRSCPRLVCHRYHH